jgi:hypothetical protein
MQPDGTIMATRFNQESGHFETPAVSLIQVKPTHFEYGLDYDVTPDGQTFLINEAVRDGDDASLSLVINWEAKINTK